MIEISSEDDLRDWLRSAWIERIWGPLIWVEAARGGTVGAPDVFVPVPRFGYIPVELKHWPRKSLTRKAKRVLVGGESFTVNEPVYPKIEMRRAQKRLHKLIHNANHKSAVLASIGFKELGVMVGGVAAQNALALNMWREPMSGAKLRALLNNQQFWDADLVWEA